MSYDEAQGYAVLATLAAPLLAMLILVFVPGNQKTAVRYISAFFPAVMLGLSVYIFAAYQFEGPSFDAGHGIQMQLHWTWIENTGFLGEDGISLYLGVDGISSLLVLL